MSTILLFIVVLSLLVFVHELGHFLMAKQMGMKVEEFGFGFPPRIFGVRRGGTDYTINWIPLGGFVRIKGESGDRKYDSDSFSSKPAWKRFIVLVAGVTMNVVLAAVLFSVGFMMGMPASIDENLPQSANVTDKAIVITEVLEGSPAAEAGFVAGEEIISIDGQVFEFDSQLRDYIQSIGSAEISVIVKALDGTYLTHNVSTSYLEEIDREGLGIGFVSTGIVAYPFFSAIGHGVTSTGVITYEVAKAFYGLIRNLIVTQEVGVELSGPVGIAVMTGEVAALGFVYLLQFAAILSINLAILNIFPFPALDGGRVLFLVIEKLRGQAVNEKVEAIVHNTGFLLLMALVVLVTFKDFVTFGDQILGALKGVIGV